MHFRRNKRKQKSEVIKNEESNENSFKDDEIYYVDAIEGSRIGPKGIFEYFVKWEGAEEPIRTWEPAENFERLNDFKEERKKFNTQWAKIFRSEFKQFIIQKYIYDGQRSNHY